VLLAAQPRRPGSALPPSEQDPALATVGRSTQLSRGEAR
jgi:hypothetical protein